MNAKQARKQSEKNRSGPVIEEDVSKINALIEEATRNGRFDIHMPYCRERAAVEAYYRLEGYVITDHPDPDPGHPCSHSYTTISWKSA